MNLSPEACVELRPPIAILGLGNEILSDDGVGVHVARALQSRLPEGSVVFEVGTSAIDLYPVLAAHPRVIALDAVLMQGPPGRVYGLTEDEAWHGRRPGSVHDLGLLDVLRLTPWARRPHVLILGVEPAIFDFGLALSPAVAAAVPEVVRLIHTLVALWQATPSATFTPKILLTALQHARLTERAAAAH